MTFVYLLKKVMLFICFRQIVKILLIYDISDQNLLSNAVPSQKSHIRDHRDLYFVYSDELLHRENVISLLNKL